MATTGSTPIAEEQPPERAKSEKLSIVALVGRRDEPTDGVRDYCAWLGGALKQRDVEFETVEVRWDQQGWLAALANFWRRSAAWHGRWVLLQYTALMWSRRGFSLAVPMILWMTRKRGCWTAVIFHDVYAAPGRRWFDRVRAGLQVRVMRHLCRRVDRAIFPVPVEQVPWLSSVAPNSVFIPVGANLPSLDELRQAGVVPKRTLPPKVAVFGVSEWPAAQKQEVEHIAQAMRRASEALGELRLYVVGRGAKEAEEALRRFLAGSRVHLTVDGVLDSHEVSARISECDVQLFVRGPLSSQRGSGLAGLACGLPIVAYEGRETGGPLRDAGILFIPKDDVAALSERLIALLRDPALRSTLASRGAAVFRRCFSWEHIAQRFAEVLSG